MVGEIFKCGTRVPFGGGQISMEVRGKGRIIWVHEIDYGITKENEATCKCVCNGVRP